MDRIVLPVPLTPNEERRGKGRWPWVRRSVYLKGSRTAVGAIQAVKLQTKVRQGPDDRRIRVHAVLVTKKQIDPDNRNAMLKLPLDALVRAGVLRNDTDRDIETPQVAWLRQEKGKPRELILGLEWI